MAHTEADSTCDPQDKDQIWKEEEIRQKEERRRGRKPMERWVSAWDLDGNRMGVWRSPSDAALEMGVPVRAVRDACNGRQKTAGGLLWRWGA